MNTSPLFKAFVSASPVRAGKHSSYSEVVTTLAHRSCPCGLTMWLLQALLMPTGTLGISSRSVGFAFFYGLYDHIEKPLHEINAMPVRSLPQMGRATAIPLHVGLVMRQQQMRCLCAPRLTGAQGWEPHSHPPCRVSLFQGWKAVASYLESGGINSWSSCYQVVFLFSFEMDIWFFQWCVSTASWEDSLGKRSDCFEILMVQNRYNM